MKLARFVNAATLAVGPLVAGWSAHAAVRTGGWGWATLAVAALVMGIATIALALDGHWLQGQIHARLEQNPHLRAKLQEEGHDV